MKEKNSVKIIAQNKKAFHDYFILETYQAGLALKGTEVKSLRAGRCNLKDSYIKIENNEAFVKNMHISPYSMGNINNVDPVRDRRLLVHKKEVLKLLNYIKQGGYTLVPSRIYSKGRWIKVELCLCRGKKLYDKREDMKKKEVTKQINIYKK